MRDLNNWEREILQQLSSLQPGISMDMVGFLNSFFFRRDAAKALILNAQSRYAMFFMGNQSFIDNAKKKEEISKFLNLFSFLKYLANEGYISFHPIENGTEMPIYYLQDSFDKIPPTSTNPIVLNSFGDCLSASDTILTKDKKLFCKGVLFEHETYDLIAKATISGFILTKDMSMASMGLKIKRSKMSVITVCLTSIILLALVGFFFSLRSRIQDHQNMLFQLLESHKEIRSNLRELRAHVLLPSTSAAQTTQSQVHYGIDVSKWNGNILTDLNMMDSISFAICKASEGIDYVDPDFASNSKFLKEKGVIWGFYHFFHTGDDPIRQAEFFLDVTGRELNAITPIVDIEQESLPLGVQPSPTKIQVDLLLFLNHLERNVGRVPMIYTDEAFANQYLNNETFAKYPLWLAEYSNEERPAIPIPWKEKSFKVWQKSSSYSVQSKLIDLDVFFGEIEELLK